MGFNVDKYSNLDDKQKDLLKAQAEQADQNFQMQMAMMNLQQKIHSQQQEAMTRSNIEKGKDDAMKAVIQNLK